MILSKFEQPTAAVIHLNRFLKNYEFDRSSTHQNFFHMQWLSCPMSVEWFVRPNGKSWSSPLSFRFVGDVPALMCWQKGFISVNDSQKSRYIRFPDILFSSFHCCIIHLKSLLIATKDRFKNLTFKIRANMIDYCEGSNYFYFEGQIYCKGSMSVRYRSVFRIDEIDIARTK